MFQIDPRSGTPIYEQIVDRMKENVLRGFLKEGDALPSIRKLALESGINPNTIGKAYQELERQGIIESIRGRGTFVAAAGKLEPDRQRLDKVRKNLRMLVVELRCLGFSPEEIAEEVERICCGLESGANENEINGKGINKSGRNKNRLKGNEINGNGGNEDA